MFPCLASLSTYPTTLQGTLDLVECVEGGAVRISLGTPAQEPTFGDFFSCRFLIADGVHAADTNRAMPTRMNPKNAYTTWSSDGDDRAEEENIEFRPPKGHVSDNGSDSDDDGSDSNHDSEEECDWFAHYPELRERISAGIRGMGGSVLPKCCWSAPIDATWVTTLNSTKCEQADEVALLLKASDRVAHDVDLFFATTDHQRHTGRSHEPCGGVPLVLKRWYDLRPECEMRCFVRNRRLVGVSQRHMTQYFPQLESRQEDILDALLRFHARKIIPSTFPPEAFVYDVYVTPQGTVKIVDINPWGGTTSPLLFSWEELENNDTSARDSTTTTNDDVDHDITDDIDASSSSSCCELRINDGSVAVQPGPQTLLGVPYDFVACQAPQDIGAMIANLEQIYKEQREGG